MNYVVGFGNLLFSRKQTKTNLLLLIFFSFFSSTRGNKYVSSNFKFLLLALSPPKDWQMLTFYFFLIDGSSCLKLSLNYFFLFYSDFATKVDKGTLTNLPKSKLIPLGNVSYHSNILLTKMIPYHIFTVHVYVPLPNSNINDHA